MPPTDKDFLAPCDNYFMVNSKSLRWSGSRNTTMEMMAGALPSLGEVSRPVVDRTGVTGKYDWMLEWAPELNSPRPPNGDVATEPAGPTFFQALKDQLGIKLEAAKAPIQILVIDRVERPSEN